MIAGHVMLPEMLLASARTHNGAVREGMVAELEQHKLKRIPGHFTRTARAQYHYMKRSDSYVSYKIRVLKTGGADLVKTGKTRDTVVGTARISVTGSAAKETIRALLRMRMPYSGGTGAQFDDEGVMRLHAALATETNPRKLAWIRKKLANRDSNRGKVGVTLAVMVREIERMTPQQKAEITAGLRLHYVRFIQSLKRPRLIAGKTLPTL